MVNMGQMAADLVYELMLGIDLALQTCKTCYIAGKSHHQAAQGAFFIKTEDNRKAQSLVPLPNCWVWVTGSRVRTISRIQDMIEDALLKPEDAHFALHILFA